MKIEIEISEETAACIWANGWGEKTGQSVALCVKTLVESHADQYRKSFPGLVPPNAIVVAPGSAVQKPELENELDR